jgi:hypothetical protein
MSSPAEKFKAEASMELELTEEMKKKVFEMILEGEREVLMEENNIRELSTERLLLNPILANKMNEVIKRQEIKDKSNTNEGSVGFGQDDPFKDWSAEAKINYLKRELPFLFGEQIPRNLVQKAIDSMNQFRGYFELRQLENGVEINIIRKEKVLSDLKLEKRFIQFQKLGDFYDENFKEELQSIRDNCQSKKTLELVLECKKKLITEHFQSKILPKIEDLVDVNNTDGNKNATQEGKLFFQWLMQICKKPEESILKGKNFKKNGGRLNRLDEVGI